MLKSMFWRIVILSSIANISYGFTGFDPDEEDLKNNNVEQVENTINKGHQRSINTDIEANNIGQLQGIPNEAGVNISNRAMEPKRDINCDEFSDYALNCTMNAAITYNSNRKSPPMPKDIQNWCKAVRYLTTCAQDWNNDCRDVTDSHFNEESINGHSYVVHNICDDPKFLQQYSEISVCVDNTSDQWEVCYSTFKDLVDKYKTNTSADWTHYETHFYLCCGRATFRRCVMETVFKRSDVCTRSQAITLQKFSVIVSEGDVYQDCEFNMIYKNCPGGDPRPWRNNLGLSQIEEIPVKLESDKPRKSGCMSCGCFPLNSAWFLFVFWLNIIVILI